MSSDIKEVGMNVIINLAQELEASSIVLDAKVAKVEKAIKVVHLKHRAEVKDLSESFSSKKKRLISLIKANKGLFEKPKSKQVDNVKLGLRKQKGKTVFPEDSDWFLKKLESLLSKKQYAECVKIERKPIAIQICELPVKLVKRLGVEIKKDTNEPFVSITQTSTEALVAEILGSAEGGK